MRSIESTGKSVDEAIFKGLQELGISIDEVDIELVNEGVKGVFGIGAKPAKVRLTEREFKIEDIKTQESRQQHREAPPQHREREERKPQQQQAKRPQQSQQQPPRKNNKPVQPRQEREERRTPPQPQIPYSLEEAERNEGAKFLAQVLKMMDVEAQVYAAKTEDALRIMIKSEAIGILIGHRGETLDSLQYLVALVVNRANREGAYTRVVLDTENYRKRREETLSRLARRIAAKVKSTGQPVMLEPMNPYERRVLHATLHSNPYVTTYSEGEDPNRRVIVAPSETQPKKGSRR